MPVNVSYPGVYIEEIPSGVHTITGVATSIAAFIDAFARGPLNEAVQVLSLGDFQRTFGGLNAGSESSYGIQQFFLNGGSEAYVVRVIGTGAVTAAIDLLDKPSGGAVMLRAFSGQMISGVSVVNPGLWGNNIRLEVDYNTIDPKTMFNLLVSEVDPNTGQVVSSESFRNLNMTSGDPAFAVDVVNNSSKLVQLSSPGASRPAATGTVSGAIPAVAIPADKSTCKVSVNGGAGKVVTLNLAGATVTDYATLRAFLEAAIRAADPNDPNLAGATVQLLGSAPGPFWFRVLSGRGGSSFSPATTLTFSDTNTALDKLATTLNLAPGAGSNAVVNVQQYSLGGATAGAQKAVTSPTDLGVGADGGAISDTALRGNQLAKTGMYALEDADLFNILCIPAAAKLSATQMQAVISEAIAYCETRRAFMIVDIPSTVQDIAGMQTWMTQNDTLRDRNAAIFFPHVMIPDPLTNGRLRDVAPSGTMAGVFAATDSARGVWKAPAGIDASLRNVSQLVYNPVDRENGVLNPLGINCLRNFPVYGNVSWGSRTLEGADVQASEWKYIPIRRLALFLEESLYRGSKWVVFEPNDEPLWAQIRLNFNAFMQTLFRQGAFQGTTPKQAYFVKCDSETTTSTDQNNGIVNILVGFAPLKPAEFVIIQIQQMAGQTA
jgi:phage tail sheath protein FI